MEPLHVLRCECWNATAIRSSGVRSRFVGYGSRARARPPHRRVVPGRVAGGCNSPRPLAPGRHPLVICHREPANQHMRSARPTNPSTREARYLYAPGHALLKPFAWPSSPPPDPRRLHATTSTGPRVRCRWRRQAIEREQRRQLRLDLETCLPLVEPLPQMLDAVRGPDPLSTVERRIGLDVQTTNAIERAPARPSTNTTTSRALPTPHRRPARRRPKGGRLALPGAPPCRGAGAAAVGALGGSAQRHGCSSRECRVEWWRTFPAEGQHLGVAGRGGPVGSAIRREGRV
jgi:hypothetical protein